MKKILFLLIALVGLANLASAETYVYAMEDVVSDVSDYSQWSYGDFTFSAAKNKGSNAPAYNTGGKDFRVYAKGTFSIKATNAEITSVSFEISTAGLKRLAEITPSVGSIVEQGANPLVWNGNSEEVSFTVGDKATYGSDGASKAGQLCFTKLIIETTPLAAPAVAKPEISVSGINEVTISCETEGASIYYTLDGAEPSASSTLYAQPIEITKNVTVKAIAYVGNDASAVASKDVTFVPTYASLAEFLENKLTTDAIIDAPATVLYQKGNRMYIQQDNTAVCVYGTVSQAYERGDIVPAGYMGRYSVYNNLDQLSPVDASFKAPTAKTEVVPELVTIDEITTALISHLVKLEGVDYTDKTVSKDGKSITVYTNTLGETFESAQNCTVTAIVGIYGETLQLYPLSVEGGKVSVAAPTFSPAAGTYAAGTTVTISCATEGATISYSFDNSTWTEYTAPVALTEAGEVTLYAKAAKEGCDDSEVASVKYTVVKLMDVRADASFDFTNPSSLTPSVTPPTKDNGTNLAGTTLTNNGVELSFTDGKGTATRLWYSNGNYDLRIYKDGGSVIVTAPEGKELVYVQLKHAEKKFFLTPDVPEIVQDEYNVAVWSAGNASVKVLTLAATATTQIESIVVELRDAAPLPAVATPVFAPAAGTYEVGTAVTITCATEGAAISYSYDNTEWTAYTAPIVLAQAGEVTLYAKATGVEGAVSEVATATYTVTNPVVATPTISPEAGSYEAGTTVTISCATEGATISYSFDNSTWTEYTEPVALTEAGEVTLYAKASKEGFDDSEVASVKYTVIKLIEVHADASFDFTNPSSLTPEVTPPASGKGTSLTGSTLTNNGVELTFTKGTADACIWNTSDVYTLRIYKSGGSVKVSAPRGKELVSVQLNYVSGNFNVTPDSLEFVQNELNSAVWSAGEANLKSVTFSANKNSYFKSIVVELRDAPKETVDAPVIALEPGKYPTGTTVEITCATEGATISYSFDNSTWTEYTAPVALTEAGEVTLYAKATKEEWFDSQVVSAQYTLVKLIEVHADATFDFTKPATLTPAIEIPENGKGTSLTDVILANNGVELTFTKGTTDACIWNTSDVYTLRIYKSGGSVKVSAPRGKELVSVQLNYVSGNFNVTPDSLEFVQNELNSAVWSAGEANLKSVTFSANKNSYFNSIVAELRDAPKEPVATPVFAPEAGTYEVGTEVTITCATEGAAISYSYDNTEWTAYTAPIVLAQAGEVTLYAKASLEDWLDSEVASVKYTVVKSVVATPTFTPEAGTYATGTAVTIACETEEAAISYSLDNTEWTAYTAPIALTEAGEVTLYAKATKEGFTDSEVASVKYTVIKLVEVRADATFDFTNPSTLTPEVAVPAAGSGTIITDMTLANNGVELTFTKGTEEARLWNNNGSYALRIYKNGGSVTVSAPKGKELANVQIKYVKNKFNVEPDTLNFVQNELCNAVWTAGEANLKSVKFSAKDNSQIESIVAELRDAPKEPVATPVFAPEAGTYEVGTEVTITCATEGAAISYSYDNTEWTAYTAPIVLAQAGEVTLYAKASLEDWLDSEVASVKYTVVKSVVATPTFTPAAGTYAIGTAVTIACETEDAAISYSLDNTEWTAYTAPIALTEAGEVTLYAKATKEGFTDSEVASVKYTVIKLVEVRADATFDFTNPTSLTPEVAIPAAGSGTIITDMTLANNGVELTFTKGTEEARLWKNNGSYALRIYKNGGSVTVSAPKGKELANVQIKYVKNKFNVEPDTLNFVQNELCNAVWTAGEANIASVKFSAKDNSQIESIVAELRDAPKEPVATPVIKLEPGTYNVGTTVEITCETEGAKISYSFDGTEWTEYTAPVALNEAGEVTLYAKATKEDYPDSEIATAKYTVVKHVVVAPVIALEPGTYYVGTTVEITCVTEGAKISYSFDGTEWTAYTAPVALNEAGEVTLYAKATKEDYDDSEVVKATYTVIKYTVANPTFTPAAGTYATGTAVTIACETEDAAISYSLDGTEWTAYTEAIALDEAGTYTIYAKATKDGYNDSETVKAAYTVVELMQVNADASFDFTNPSTLTPEVAVPAAGSGTIITDMTLANNGVELTFTKGTEEARLWNNNGNYALRIYKNGGSVTVTAPAGKELVYVEFKYVKGKFKMEPESQSFVQNELCTAVWAAGDDNVTSVVFKANDNSQIEAINVELRNAATGIEGVTIDAAEAEYYNMQGIRVDSDNLTPGFYVVRRGKTVTKVLVK